MRRAPILTAVAAAVTLLAGVASAGEYHSGNSLLCSDCHTAHFSMQHSWDSSAAPAIASGGANGNWLGATGPNEFLLKAPANQLCLGCHDGKTFAPDVFGVNSNTSPSQGRSAGALNDQSLGGPHEAWKGHTLGATTASPGFNPAVIGAPTTWYDPTRGLECVSCHSQHGAVTAYRNLGPSTLGGAATAARPTYAIGTSNDTTKDVWINIPTGYVAGSGNAATFNPYYDYANVTFNRNDATVGTNKTSNRIDTFCAACHGDFHGGPGDTNIGATAAALDGFLRHPTSQVTLGAAGNQGYDGHSALGRYVAATTKTRVYASDRVGYTDGSPGCLSCHKAHGNQNPFGLFFLNRTATAVDEQGGYASDQAADLKTGYRNLCGQCHGQGN